MSVANSRNYQYKIVLLGDSAVGKSSLVTRFIKKNFVDGQESTIGAAFVSQTIVLDGCNIRLDIWDTAGQERYHSLAPMYYRGAKGAIVVYDVTSRGSLARAKAWVQELHGQGDPSIVIMLAANKIDLPERVVEPEEGAQLAEELCCRYIETSAKGDINVDTLFEDLARTLPREDTAGSKAGGIVIEPDLIEPPPSRGCC